MKKLIYYFFISMAFIGFTSCGGSGSDGNDDMNSDSTDVVTMDEPVDLEAGGIHLYEADIAKEFKDAILTLNAPTADMVTEPGPYTFSFAVENYELAKQTDGADSRHCANSNKGQHIHFIVNNGPYAAHYETELEGEMMEGNNVVLAFLSRSYHESIKTQTAHILTNYVIGDVDDEFDESAEHLFFSRPKGTYTGADTKKILLDFYLINADLSVDGYKVRATINGNEFILPKWAPYFVEGLPMGENKIRIELIDPLGELVEGPFNDSGERTIVLEEAAEGV